LKKNPFFFRFIICKENFGDGLRFFKKRSKRRLRIIVYIGRNGYGKDERKEGCAG